MSSGILAPGKPFQLPSAVTGALQRLFGQSIGAVRVIEHSRYARLHVGMSATTRPQCILLAVSGKQFIARPELVLHEYFHVLRQWETGRLTRWRYLAESLRRGYWDNRFEREARDFASANLARYLAYLHHASRDPSKLGSSASSPD